MLLGVRPFLLPKINFDEINEYIERGKVNVRLLVESTDDEIDFDLKL